MPPARDVLAAYNCPQAQIEVTKGRDHMRKRGQPAMIARNVTVNGRRTSLRLEPAMWSAIFEVAVREQKSLHRLCSEISRKRGPNSLTSAVRLYLLHYFQSAATEAGHAKARHGKKR
jgi:predicted DNA-binding ribbon-helix-helix protein